MHGRILYVQGFLYHRVIIFGSVQFLSKKVTKPKFFLKKTETEPKPGQTDWFRCSSIRFFRAKTDSNRFGSVLLGFFRFFSDFGSVRFGFFGFWLIKPKPNRTGRFFQNFNRFFFSVWFFRLFFFWFSRFNRFFWFFCSPLLYHNTCHQLFVEHNSNKIMLYKIV